MATIGELVVQLTADTNRFLTSMKDAEESLAKVGTVAVAAGAAVITALVGMAQHAAETGDKLNDMSKISGTSVEQLQVLGFAAEQSGSSLEGMSTGLKFLSKNIVAAAGGAKEQSAAFKVLGVNVKDAGGHLRSTNDVLLDVADVFAKTEDGAAKTALALKIFGKSGAELIPTLNEGRAGIEAMGKQLADVGGIMSTELAQASDQYNDSVNLLNKSLEGLSFKVGSLLIPQLTSLVDKITPVVAGFSKWAGENPGLLKGIEAIALALVGAGGLVAGASGLALILPTITSGIALLGGTAAAIASGGITLLITGIIVFRRELIAGLLGIKAFITEGLAKLVNAISFIAGKAGLDGLHDKLKDAVFWLEQSADASMQSAAAWVTESGEIKKTADAHDNLAKTAKRSLGIVSSAQDELHKKTQQIVKDNRNKLFEYQNDIQQAMTRSIDFITDKYVKARDTINRILTQNQQNVSREVDQINAQITRNLDQAADDFSKQLGEFSKIQGEKLDEINKKQKEKLEEWRNVWSTAMGGIVKDFVDAVTDIIFEGGSFVDKMANLGKETAKTFVKAFLLELTSPITEFLSGLGKTLADKLSGALGGAGGGGGGLGSVLGRGGGAAPGGGGGGVGGALGAVGAIGSAVGAAAGIGGIFQQKRLEGTMNAVEHNTRYSMIYLETMINDFLHPWSSTFDWLLVHAGEHTNQLDAIFNVLNERLAPRLGGGAPLLAADVPGGGGNFIVNMNVTAPISVVEKIDRQSVREEVMPEWIEAFETNIGGYRAKIVEIVKNTMDGIVATRNPV